MRPKKSLGQNFLINKGAARRIAQLVLETNPKQILEIGGGRGDLTNELLQMGSLLNVVEIDRALAEKLRLKFSDQDNFKLIEQDILNVDPEHDLNCDTATLVGNIPYNITSPILEWLVQHRDFFPYAILMMQREVAERVCAVPGGKQFGSLTVFVQLFYECQREFTLKPGSFFPPPKVSSAVIRLSRLEKPLIKDSEYGALRRLTSACFRWRRKQLSRILRDEYSLGINEIADLLAGLHLDLRMRPEQLHPGDFVRLSREIARL